MINLLSLLMYMEVRYSWSKLYPEERWTINSKGVDRWVRDILWNGYER